MKIHRHTKSLLVAAAAFATLGFHPNLMQAQDDSVTQTNIARSMFVIPKEAVEGRDPFFPNTTRSLSGEKTLVKTAAAAPLALLVLNGLSGTPDHRLAMINGRTLAQGESSDISIGGVLVKVRCVEIKEKTVVVESGGTRQELFMRGEK